MLKYENIQDLLIAHGFIANALLSKFVKGSTCIPYSELYGHSVATFYAKAIARGWIVPEQPKAAGDSVPISKTVGPVGIPFGPATAIVSRMHDYILVSSHSPAGPASVYAHDVLLRRDGRLLEPILGIDGDIIIRAVYINGHQIGDHDWIAAPIRRHVVRIVIGRFVNGEDVVTCDLELERQSS